MNSTLPPLPYDEWAPAKWTLHLYLQIVGKIHLATTHHRNHWWNVPFYLTARGLDTHGMMVGERRLEMSFDFIDNRVIITTADGGERSIALVDGLSVKEFYYAVFRALDELGIALRIWAKPFGVPIETRFDQDDEHHNYDADAVRRWWRILSWSADVFEEYAGEFAGKTSPVHLFWHSLDLAVSRFSGRRAPSRDGAGIVEREAYSHEVISGGFWPGDETTRFPAYYGYTAPEPGGLANRPLEPESARWNALPGGSHLAILPYDDIRALADPRAALLAFLRSNYDAGASLAKWDVAAPEPFPKEP
ncbi:MAG TPA: DUF5996 family protein [Candidatus Baltobacteraceae bacterium]|nr:DUF5996 family protein [Candidatus Baltobacteraceae bacterium]